MKAVLDLQITGAMNGFIAIPEGATVRDLKEALSVAGYPVKGTYTRLWRGVDQDDVYIGHLDNMPLKQYDSLCFCNDSFCIAIDNIGAHGCGKEADCEKTCEKGKQTITVDMRDYPKTVIEPYRELSEAQKKALDNACIVGTKIRKNFTIICDQFAEIKDSLNTLFN